MDGDVPRVLLVEDEPAHAELIRRAFASWPERMDLTLASTVAEARARIADAPPDLVMADLQLPDGNGIDLLAAEGEEPHLPIVVLTAHGDEPTAVEAMKRGALDYVVKSESALADAPHLCQRVLREWRQILQRKRVEAALRESEQKYRSLVENSIAGIVIVQGNQIRLVNRAALEIFGYQTAADVLGRPFTDFVAPEYRELMVERGRAREAGQDVPAHYEFKGLRRDGSPFDGEVSVGRITYQGSPARQAIVRDVTRQKRAENLVRTQWELALALSGTSQLEEGLGLCVQAAMDVAGMDLAGVYLIDEDTGGLELVFHRGLSADFVRSASHYEPESPHTRLVMAGEPMHTQHAKLGVPLTEVKHREGLRAIGVLPFRHAGRVIGCLNVASHTVAEVPALAQETLETIAATIGGSIARLKAQQALQESEHRYRRIVETAHEGIWVIDAESNTSFVNRRMAEMLGYSVEEMAGKSLFAFMHEPSRPTEEEHLERRRQGIVEQYDFVFRRKDGSDMWAIVSSNPIHDAQGQYLGTLGMITDITQRKRAEEARRESEQRYRHLFDRAPVGIGISTFEGKVTGANAAMLAITGRSFEDWKDVNLADTYENAQDRQALLDALSRDGRVVDFSARLKRKDGTVYDALLNVSRIDFGGEVFLHTICQDVSERKRAEEALRESEARYRLLAENATDVIWTADLDLRYTYISPSAEMLRGFTVAEMMSQTLEETLAPPSVELARRTLAEELQRFSSDPPSSPVVKTLDLEQLCKDGSTVWTEVKTRLLVGRQGEPVGLVGVTRDITQRRRVEEAYRSLVDHSLQGLAIFQEGRVAFANQALAEISGYSIEEMLALTPEQVEAFVHPEDRALVWGRHSGRLNGEPLPERYEFRGIRKDGSVCWLEIHAQRIEYQGKPAVQAAYVDVTQRKRAEQGLREQQEILQAILDNAPIMITFVDADGRHRWVNRCWEQTLGWSLEEVRERDVLEDCYPDPAYRQDLLDFIRQAVGTWRDFRTRRRDGSVINTCWANMGLSDGSKVGIGQDITARKRAETALRESELRLRTIFDSVSSGMFLLDLETRKFVMCNAMCASMLGVAQEEFLNLDVPDVHPPEDLPLILQQIGKFAEGEQGVRHDIRFRRKDGTVFFADLSPALMTMAGRRFGLVAFSDISERKAAEEKLRAMETQLAHVTRLSAMGEMVAGIAHEINQPLYSILNFAKASRNVLAAESPPRLDELRQWNDEIATAAARAGDILHRLRVFARKTEPSYSPASISEVVDEAVRLLAFETQQQRIAVQVESCEPCPPVRVCRVRIQQVLVNLLRNAYEAVAEGSADARWVTIRITPAGGFVEISVADNGPGLPPDDQLDLFEPFVTTKPEGLGMGLPISRSIVEAHGGRLWASSGPQQGAVFHFTLPVVTGGGTDGQ